ncbi:MAG: MBL fold metallo-hydrolase [Clostridia bacterium]|nr:MBL fold metallo-hydrolase [Clostridia bacterium]
MATDPKKKAQTKAKSKAKRNVKKAARKNPGLVVALVALLIVVVVVVAVLYLKVPAVHDAITNIISQESSTSNSTNNSGNNRNANLPVLERGEGELRVHFVDVGQGDCIYIEFPDGKDMLIDCGNEDKTNMPDSVATNLQSRITDGKLDYLMLTHADQDHVGYMDEVLEMFEVSTIYMPNILANNSGLASEINALDSQKLAKFTDDDKISTAVYAKFFIAALTEENCQIVINKDADDSHNSIVISDDSTYNLTFYCMTEAKWASTNLNSAEKKNAVSPIGILEYNGVRIVLTGDSNERNEPDFIRRVGSIDCDVLKVGHHGSQTSSTTEFLNAISCEYAVFCCGTGNGYQHPRQAAINRMSSYTEIYRTDLNGNIVLTINASGEFDFHVDREATQEQERIGADAA